MKKTTSTVFGIAALAAVAGLIFAAQGDTLTWTGGSATSDNFSDAANWSPSQVPASGDKLVFGGETRTTPYNDLDPDTVSFAGFTFTNDNTSGKTASFTITGNKIKLTGGITLAAVPSDPSITETFNVEVEYVGSSGSFTIGATSNGRHNLTFNKEFLCQRNGVQLQTPNQYTGTIYFNGDITGFQYFYRPNGGANIYFHGVNTSFWGDSGYNWGQGNMYFIDADNFGPAPKFHTGQGGYATAGSVYFDPTNDVTITAKIGVASPSQAYNGLTLVNRTAGKTVTFTGDVYEAGTKLANGSDAGTRLVVDGVGDGVFKGNFTQDRMAFTKQGTGTWILSDEIETCSMTGLVTVSAGKLVVDCALQPNQYMTIASSGTIAGKGTLGSPVTFKGNSKYEVSVNGDGTHNTLAIPGAVTLEGNVTVNRTGGEPLAPGSRTALLTFTSKSGVGSFIVGSGFPGNAAMQIDGNTLYVDVPSDTLTWTGATSGYWNFTDANWSGSSSVFSDGAAITFPDIADAAKRTVSIPSPVRPVSVVVSAAADHPYVFSGEGMIETSSIDFSGTATNTLSAPVSNVGALLVSAGRLVLDGDVTDSIITVGEGASLTQTVNSAISGASAISAYRTTVDLLGTNTFTSGLIVGGSAGYLESSRTDVNIRSPGAIGNGDVNVKYYSYLNIYADTAVTNHTLHIWGYNNYSQVKIVGSHTFDWAGDIVVHEYPNGETFATDYGEFRLGKDDLTSTFSTTIGRAVVVVGDIHMYANFRSGSSFGFRNNLWLYSTNNVWSAFCLNTGNAYMMAKNVLPPDKPVTMLQRYAKVQYQANLHLNGFDQTISALNVTDYDKTVSNWARIKTTLPATLTISNATDSSFSDITTFYVQDCVTLRKMGLGKWTIGCQNTSTGDFEVVEGTVALAAAESLPVGAKSTVRVADAAALEIPESMEAEISYAERIIAGRTRMVRAGLYGSNDCTVPGATKVDWLAGAGTLHVKRDKGGTLISFH